MEKRVLFSAFIVLLASFLAFNFGGGTPTGQFSTSGFTLDTKALTKCFDDTTNLPYVDKSTLITAGQAYAIGLGGSYGGLKNPIEASRMRKLIEGPLSEWNTDKDGSVGYFSRAEYACVSAGYGSYVKGIEMGSSKGRSSQGGFCSEHQIGQKWCTGLGFGDAVITCVPNPTGPGGVRSEELVPSGYRCIGDGRVVPTVAREYGLFR